MESSKLHDLIEDAADAPAIPFVSMLKAFLIRGRGLDQGHDQDRHIQEGHRRSARNQKPTIPVDTDTFTESTFNLIVDDASDFCNGTTDESSKLKDALRTA